jgi:hypothetical protein
MTSFFDDILHDNDSSEASINTGNKRIRDESDISDDLINKIKKLREDCKKKDNLILEINKNLSTSGEKLAASEEKLAASEEKLAASEEKLSLYKKLIPNLDLTSEISNNVNCKEIMEIFTNIINNCDIDNTLKMLKKVDFEDDLYLSNLLSLIKNTDKKTIKLLNKNNNLLNIKKQFEYIERSNKLNYKHNIVNTIFKCDFNDILLVNWDDDLFSMVIVCNECNSDFPSLLNVKGCLQNEYKQNLYYVLNNPTKIEVLTKDNVLESLEKLFEEKNLKNLKDAVNYNSLLLNQFKIELWKATKSHILNRFNDLSGDIELFHQEHIK